jgi:hypothetical protein
MRNQVSITDHWFDAEACEPPIGEHVLVAVAPFVEKGSLLTGGPFRTRGWTKAMYLGDGNYVDDHIFTHKRPTHFMLISDPLNKKPGIVE